MKLKKYDTVAACDAGAELQLKDPFTGELTEDFITLVGVDSNTFKAGQRRLHDFYASHGDATIPYEAVLEAQNGVLADCTRSWRLKDDDGKDIPFSRDAAVELYTAYPRIKDQVNAFIGGVANFRRD